MVMDQQSPNSSWRNEYTENLMCIFELISKTLTQVEESDNLLVTSRRLIETRRLMTKIP